MCVGERKPSSRSIAWWLFLLPPPSSCHTLQNPSLQSAGTLCPLEGSVPKGRNPALSWHGWQLLACRFQSNQSNRSSADLDDSTSVQPRMLFCVQDVWRWQIIGLAVCSREQRALTLKCSQYRESYIDGAQLDINGIYHLGFGSFPPHVKCYPIFECLVHSFLILCKL